MMAQGRRSSTSRSRRTRSGTLMSATTSVTSRPLTGRPRTDQRPFTAMSGMSGVNSQQIICAISESRGVSPTVGLAFVNMATGEAVLSQLCDSQSYVLTVHKLNVFEPTQILIQSTAANANSKMCAIIAENVNDARLVTLDRKYWAETAGLEYIERLAFIEDVEAIKVSTGGNYYATACIAAALKYIEMAMSVTFTLHSLRVSFQPPEGSMMIDRSSVQSLELIQNLQNTKSRDCLFGLLNETLTPMGSRLLRSNILQPLTDSETLNARYDALQELTTKEDMFFGTRKGLKLFQDVDKVLMALITVPTKASIQLSEQAINNIMLLKLFANSIDPIYEALNGAESCLLSQIRSLCHPDRIGPVRRLIDETINADITYKSKPLDLKNQRTHAVKTGVNGLLDVARQTCRDGIEEIHELCSALEQQFELGLEVRFDNARQFYMHFPASKARLRDLDPVLTNVVRRKNSVECQTVDMMKLNQRLLTSAGDKLILGLIDGLRDHVAVCFKVSEAIGMLDMIAAFGQVVTTREYTRPELTDTLAIKAGRHPVHEKVHAEKFVPNDAYATQASRFQVVTGCNMSGKSTYIRMIALHTVLAQIGCFVPAFYASIPIRQQLFARVSMDDSIEANVSTFASEMRETAFILRNLGSSSLIIIDELGRGTSSRDGLAIALSVAEALIESRALVWFATHFKELADILSARSGVVNLHLAVEMSDADRLKMLYKVSAGSVRQRHYGLALARMVELPQEIFRIATETSHALSEQNAKRKRSSESTAIAGRRKILLKLKETLIQARDGSVRGRALTRFLQDLQKEFISRMAAIDAAREEHMVDLESRSDYSRDPGSSQETVATTESQMQSPEGGVVDALDGRDGHTRHKRDTPPIAHSLADEAVHSTPRMHLASSTTSSAGEETVYERSLKRARTKANVQADYYMSGGLGY